MVKNVNYETECTMDRGIDVCKCRKNNKNLEEDWMLGVSIPHFGGCPRFCKCLIFCVL